jgi:hypothetical protein
VRHICVMSKDDPHFRLRIPKDLGLRIADIAKANARSINAEIVFRLRESVESEEVFEDSLKGDPRRMIKMFSKHDLGSTIDLLSHLRDGIEELKKLGNLDAMPSPKKTAAARVIKKAGGK